MLSTEESWTPVGWEEIAPAQVTPLSPPSDADRALIQALVQDVRWTDSGASPSASTGIRLSAGASMTYLGDLKALKFIQEVAGAKVTVMYYRKGRR